MILTSVPNCTINEVKNSYIVFLGNSRLFEETVIIY